MFSNKLYTPLRYPGGKARFAPLLEMLVRKNGLEGGHYFEPYAGGAGLALVLLMDNVVEQIHINDVDPAIACFWRSAVNCSEALVNRVANAEVTMDAWHHWRDVMFGRTSASDLDRAFATLFMNRTNRSGILKGGVIGGKGQAGTYKLDARFMRDKICSRLERIGLERSRINVYEEDALSLLARCGSFLPEKSMIYLDPPYYVKGAGLYRNSYKDGDHRNIAKALQSEDFSFPWVVSYDNVKEIRDMYSDSARVTYGLNYTAQRRYIGDEVMFFSFDLKHLPEQQSSGAELKARSRERATV